MKHRGRTPVIVMVWLAGSCGIFAVFVLAVWLVSDALLPW
jgi:hypothetical protein